MARVGCVISVCRLLNVQNFGYNSWVLVRKNKIYRMRKTDEIFEFGICLDLGVKYCCLTLEQMDVVYGIDSIIYTRNRLYLNLLLAKCWLMITQNVNSYSLYLNKNYRCFFVDPVQLNQIQAAVNNMYHN